MNEIWLRKKEMHEQTGLPMQVIDRICRGEYKHKLTRQITPGVPNSPILIWKEKALFYWKEGFIK